MSEDIKAEIKTSHINPPIPVRDWDWVAYRDGNEERGPRGFGATKESAISDLLDWEGSM